MSDRYNEEDDNKETGVSDGSDIRSENDRQDAGKEESLQEKHPDASRTKNAGKGDNSEYEDVCFICRRPESKAGKMFKLPNNICVCGDCMHRTMDTVSQFDYQGMLNSSQFQQEMDEFARQNGFPNISFVNLADLQGDGGIPNKQKLKKKKKRNRRRP